MKKWYVFLFIVMLSITPRLLVKASVNQIGERMDLYNEFSFKTGLPWHVIAAVDQYERNTKNYRDYCTKKEEVISICIDPKIWSGYNNPLLPDRDPFTISLFHGIGTDGDFDGYADINNPRDRLASILEYITDYGLSEKEITDALLNYYKKELGVKIIWEINSLFQKYNKIDLKERVFPIPKYYEASYSNGFGANRSWGGNRKHEGIDIFAHYGTPVLSTSYGVIEIMGWNKYGGYRIGIRDMYNSYQFYAHLNSYAKIKEGDIVEPGQVIGYVGSTGYGKEGTSGKFPPHLHFGLYKFDGKNEWSFNPYNVIRTWPKVSLKRR